MLDDVPTTTSTARLNGRGPVVVEEGDPLTNDSTFSLAFDQDLGEVEFGMVDVASGSGPVDVLMSAGVSSARLIGLRVLSGGPLDVILTWANGTAQRIPIDDLYLWKSRNQVVTGLLVEGDGTVQYVVSGAS